jgi:hypothetical protein
MTDPEIKVLLDGIRRLATEQCEAFVFIAVVEDENGHGSTIRSSVGDDSRIIGMMDLLAHDIRHGRVIDKVQNTTQED